MRGYFAKPTWWSYQNLLTVVSVVVTLVVRKKGILWKFRFSRNIFLIPRWHRGLIRGVVVVIRNCVTRKVSVYTGFILSSSSRPVTTPADSKTKRIKLIGARATKNPPVVSRIVLTADIWRFTSRLSLLLTVLPVAWLPPTFLYCNPIREIAIFQI